MTADSENEVEKGRHTIAQLNLIDSFTEARIRMQVRGITVFGLFIMLPSLQLSWQIPYLSLGYLHLLVVMLKLKLNTPNQSPLLHKRSRPQSYIISRSRIRTLLSEMLAMQVCLIFFYVK